MMEKELEPQKHQVEQIQNTIQKQELNFQKQTQVNSFVQGHLVDIVNREIYPAEIIISNGHIQKITRVENAPDHFILPGFVDAHIHIESSMLVPTEFAKIALVHGTVATVSDPHEIANVCGVAGVDFMIDNARKSPLKFYFGAPSCVPATNFETSGAVLDAKAVAELLDRPEIHYLSEMMNFPGVLNEDPEVMAKINAAKIRNKSIDGHAPGLRNGDAERYASFGISTDHECFAYDEAVDKIKAGMYILIREGSAAKNFDALISLFEDYPRKLMFCSDDKHPDELMKGHINQLVARAIAEGCDLFEVLYAACVLPVQHYQLEVGLLEEGAPADFILVNNLKDFIPLQTYVDGNLVANDGQSLVETEPAIPINNFKAYLKKPEDFFVTPNSAKELVKVRVILALEGQIITKAEIYQLKVENGRIMPDLEKDILYIGVVNRYEENGSIAMGFVKNFGFKKGAIASSVAHDSHNIVFVGCDPESISDAVNAVIEVKGGISVVDGNEKKVMSLPVAGLMTTSSAPEAAMAYEELDAKTRELGATLSAPFMALSFMALPVIPELKITDQGLFDVSKFAFTNVEMDEN